MFLRANDPMPEHIYNPITTMGFLAMFTFQLDIVCIKYIKTNLGKTGNIFEILMLQELSIIRKTFWKKLT